MRSSGITHLLLLTLALAAPATSWAESDFGRLNRQGEEAYQAEHYQDAADLLQQAYAIKPVPALLFNIARAYERTGSDEQAIRFYQRYLDAEGTDAETVKKAARALDLLRTKVAQKAIDDAKVAQEKAAQEKAAQEKAAQEKAAQEKAASAQGAATKPTQPSSVTPASKPAVVASTPVEATPQRSLVPGVLVLSIGVVAGAVGVGFGVSASNQETAFNQTFDPAKRPQLRQTAQNQAHVADGFYAGAACTAAVGIFLLVRAIPPSAPASGPTAFLLPGGAALAWSGTW